MTSAETLCYIATRKQHSGKGEIVKNLRINRRIRASEVLVIEEDGKQLGVMPLYKAWELAGERELDLVEVAPTANPPVCRLLDYGKFKYEQTKKERQTRKTQKSAIIRDVRLRPNISKHDLELKARLVRKLIDNGDKVKVMVIFRGREVTHPAIAYQLLRDIYDTLKDIAAVDRQPAMEGRNMNIILSPLTARKHADESAAAKES